ncbi:MAG: carboxypeptidase regulatory-like domain-containing protein [Edaphobacter sp.]|uniref:TonB-dependent receptor n=1 Tax=Edaphobacter sp. TaxID=1934404 RepID=UPI002397BC14|nr:carboxypeptidase regulatory-like domain-containing protein [Edaphobacter sp.]MDE1177945.1 carboxypeptidase regulatory-like domain-containing protein [Edaphobacter sp.]
MQFKFSRVIGALMLTIALAVTSLSANAQSSFGQISGSVDDPTGAAVPEAQITITANGTQNKRVITSDAGGGYIATNLPIGEYSISVTKTGFRTAQQSGVYITADAKVTSNFILQIGQANEVVEVQGGAIETLNTTSGEVARVIDSKQVENLALNGRNYTQLLTLIPGAVVTNPDIFSVTTSLASTNQTINGNRGDTGNLTVDGAFNQASGSNGSLMNNVGPDFISEVKIDTSNASAEYGRNSGPTFNIVTKSGTNAFHGGAFEFLRNNYLDSANYIARKKTQLIYNDFGFFVGGPIIKDKLFFFVGEEWKRLRQQATATTYTVPTTAMLNGDFSALCTGAGGSFNSSGTCSNASGQLYQPGTATPIANNNIASQITPDGRAIANVYKTISAAGLSFRDGGIPSNNLTLAPSNPFDFHQDLVRFDYVINQKHSIYGRWIHDKNSLIDPFGTFSNSGILNTTPTQRNRPGQSYLVSYTWAVSSNLINQAQANASWAAQRIPPVGDNWKRETYGFEFAKIYPNAGTYPNGIPQVNTTNFAGMQGPNFALLSPTTDIQVGDTLTWIKGNHTMKFGAVVIRDRVDQNGRANYTGTANFQPANCGATGRASNVNTTCYALADSFLGNFSSYSEASADPMGHFRFTQPEAFAQDSWRATRKLSLEFGIRWQGIFPWYTQGNNIGNFDPAVYARNTPVTLLTNGRIDTTKGGNPYAGLVRAGSGVPADQQIRVPNVNTSLFPLIPAGAPRGLFNSHGSFGPRFGFAYSMDDKTVIRGGVGMFYYRAQGNLIFSQLNIAPFLSNTNLDFGNLATLNSVPAAATTQAGINAIDPNSRTPYTYQYSLGVQRQLSRSILFELNYVGSVSHGQLATPNINFPALSTVAANRALGITNTTYSNPYKGFTSIGMNRFASNYNYNSLQAFASKRAGFLTSTIAYTYSKALGDSNGNNQTLENWSNLSYNYGYLSNDRRHAFVATFVAQAPELKGHNIVVREVAGGWQLSGVARLQSGAYYNLQAVSALGVGNVRPSYNGGKILANNHAGLNGYVCGTAASGCANPFTVPTGANYGNAPYGAVEGPGLAQTDVTLSKFFPITERVRIKIQADAFNVLNRTNFNGLNLTTTNSNFGTISSAFPPRQLQLAARLVF